ncbi:MAG: Phospho-N-acetylmuramoyl-pentapeptide-transferase [candidate division WS6 bacterium GW2011_GWF2_39_15]|uniref:Phospho-N-acetylmuramoyl-pentapeptide-transferase n=1 Tax=candidate division WS6 bacterium GW2011_GWF2_39_15 TaxID=1619100 RepID=A0A0G0Q6X4_9BACT|nr:MAG: Phospho-N-acetylmuramoyl-pentapeptide-transferase [candidate division WS6 bacterium GW2011_GWF2_39_15]
MKNEFIVLIGSSVIAALILPFLINILYRLNIRDRGNIRKKDGKLDNKVFVEILGGKAGTPKGGGIIWLILFPVISFFLFGTVPLNLILIAITLVYGLIGLLDDSKKISGFKLDHLVRKVKFVVEVGIGVLFSHLLITNLNLSNSLFNYAFITFLFTSYTNAFNINDGLDGLLTGQTIWMFTGMLILTMLQHQNTVAMYYAIMIGILIVFLYFNINPARIFMGDVGSMSLGVIALALAVASNNLLPFIIMTVPSILTIISSLIQMLSIKFLGKKVFKIAPLHHHFQALGWNETKVTERYWLAQIFFVFLALAVSTL